MSNLSDIGFPVKSERDVNDIILQILPKAREIQCPTGVYLKFFDPSGAEIYLQGNLKQELIGFNPHFAGKSKRLVCLTKAIERDASELDGGFHAWANPVDESGENGDYPFVFDVPDFRVNTNLAFPRNREIQLTAFASNEFEIFSSEPEHYKSQDKEPHLASRSFIPSGLFSLKPENEGKIEPPMPIGIFTGEIKEFELKVNELTQEGFYWFLIDTLGGEVDVVADPKLIPSEPKIGGILQGQFWLSGRLLED